MKELIINSANSNLIVLLNVDGEISFLNEESVKKHNEIILSLIDNLLKEKGIELKDIDEFGVVVGPGSFTGIRVGIATIKAFRDVFNKRAKGINNLSYLYELGKDLGVEVYAIEGSLNSFFVAEVINGKLFIYNKNVSTEELIRIANSRAVGVVKLTENLKELGINFCELKFLKSALVEAFHKSDDENLVPIYYQLSQAEEEKINRSELLIRPFELKDIDEIIKIENENFKVETTGEKPYSREMLKKVFENNMPNFVGEINGVVAGYIFLEKTDEVNISRIAVSENFQNHGVATRLIEFVLNECKKENMNLSLEVSENNIKAMKLYKKLGFEERRIRKNYYMDGANCIEMIKNTSEKSKI